jgi:MFS family permease
MDNPYRPSDAAMKDAPPAPRSPILAVLAGLAVDFGGTLLSSIAIAIVYAVMLAAEGTPLEQIQSTVTEVDPRSGYFVFSTLVGGAFSILGGYVCARVARRNERKVCAILALVGAFLGFLTGAGADPIGPLLDMAFVVLTLASVMLGGELGRRSNVARARASGDVSVA